MVILSLMSSLFISSFSSVISAILLIFTTLLIISVMYWNLVSMIPLYLFSLFMMGGLYVLIGFVMMADMKDLDMVSGEKSKSHFLMFLGFFLGFYLNTIFSDDLDLDFTNFSPVLSNDWSTSSGVVSVFVFLVFILLVYLFVLHPIMKSSYSGGGFVS